ncbi:hypothetical protein QE152_g13768 [Popillia japonica]|uniref:Uncharacterized protein n=1 Tax=Popillia japonica TaxID=7064 RepID=A0AAW1LBD4_POPJA
MAERKIQELDEKSLRLFITEMLTIYSQKFGSYSASTDQPEERTTTSPPNDATNDPKTEFSHPRKMMKERRTTQPLTRS